VTSDAITIKVRAIEAAMFLSYKATFRIGVGFSARARRGKDEALFQRFSELRI
jgi:hypothetical protein